MVERSTDNKRKASKDHVTGGRQAPGVVFLDRDTLSPETRLRKPAFPHRMQVFAKTTPAQVAERIRDADIVITNKAVLKRDAIAEAKNLRLVAVAATGTDVVDLNACEERGVAVVNIRNYAVNTVPEHTFALIFALRRSIVAYRDAVIRGRWQQAGQFCFFDFPIRDLTGCTLGIIGDGALGRSVADLGRAFGMRVLFAEYKGSSGMGPLYTPFDEVMRTSDILTPHVAWASQEAIQSLADQLIENIEAFWSGNPRNRVTP